MSHFTVLVVGDNPEDQLAPFQECDEGKSSKEIIAEKWDWYVLGGRWTGTFKLKEDAEGKLGRPGVMNEPAEKGSVDSALKKDIDNIKDVKAFAILKDGTWYERGEMGWWGCVSDEKDQDVWDIEFTKLLESISDNTLLSMYDCHI